MTYVLTDVCRAVADPTRRAILEELRSGGRSVGDLAARFPISQPAVSQHLRVLREARLVRATAHGRQRIYRLDGRPLAELDLWLESYRDFWGGALDRLKAHAEARATSTNPDSSTAERRRP